MKFRPVLYALALGAASQTSPALAEKVVVAECSGNGAHFYLSDVERDEADLLADGVGAGPSPSADAVFVIDRGRYRWDTRSRAAIDRDCGGDGNDELELFRGIQPRSGRWQARLGETRLDGCPAVMQNAFPKSPGALPAEWRQPRRLTFDVPFHPDQLELTRSLSANGKSRITWRNAGDDAWRTEVFPELFGQIPAGQGKGSKMSWTLTVASETEIEHTTMLDIALPAAMSQLTGGARSRRMTSENRWLRVGD